MRKPARIGILLIVLTVALAAIGVASALWFDELWIDGVVITGNVDVEPTLFEWWDNEIEKDVATCTPYLRDGTGWYIEILNGYPSYECWVTVDIHSLGTIPVHVYQPLWDPFPSPNELTFRSDCWDGMEYIQLHQGDTAYCTFYFHVEQGALQNYEYYFHGWVEARQFNEPRMP